MENYKPSMLYALFVFILITIVIGCKYDVAESPWYSPYTLPPSTDSLQILPEGGAVGGVNYITINAIKGAGFAGSKAIDHVYFDNAEVDTANIVSISTTAITVRRPNVVTDTGTIKVNSYNNGLVAKFKPYRITSLYSRYGGFVDNRILGALEVDNAGTLYAATGVAPFSIEKVAPDGGKTILVDTIASLTSPQNVVLNPPTDMKIGPGGYLYLLRSHRLIQRVNVTTGEVTPWHNLKDNRALRFGDFANGYFYVGGGRTDLYIIAPDSTSIKSEMYAGANDSIYAVHVYNNQVYVAATFSGVRGIWRHSIDANGNLGARDSVFGLTGTKFSSRVIRDFALSSDGMLYLASDSPDPLLIVNLATQEPDYFYKNIIPPYAMRFAWGNGNSMYLMSGSNSPAQEWTVYKVDMGASRAGK